ncbi:MAG: heat-inducible transcriptional repressor [Actinomycetota bacterium]|jgi:heat-inducible transcriptional repressor|nr:heat-inducible transcriptional repressor [Actinomycetota bacterium]
MAVDENLGERRSEVLRAIVSHYVNSGEPVGSKTLVERFNLGVSSATVRNEMGALEDSGYIYQPHTSAGRVPTDAGYRYFVDSSGETKLPKREAALIRRFFGEPRYELEESLRQTAGLLSSLTDHAAVVFAPVLERSVIRHVELVPLSGQRAMVVVVANTGRVENHIVPVTIDEVQLDRAAEMMNRLVIDQPLESAGTALLRELERFPLELRDAATAVATTLDRELTDPNSERVFLDGASNILREEKASDLETVRQVIGALEHRRLLLEVLADALSSSSVSVRIGSENSLEEMQSITVITAPYGTDDEPIGSLGIVGPTRMDYKRTIAAVHEVASSLGHMLGELGL